MGEFVFIGVFVVVKGGYGGFWFLCWFDMVNGMMRGVFYCKFVLFWILFLVYRLIKEWLFCGWEMCSMVLRCKKIYEGKVKIFYEGIELGMLI